MKSWNCFYTNCAQVILSRYWLVYPLSGTEGQCHFVGSLSSMSQYTIVCVKRSWSCTHSNTRAIAGEGIRLIFWWKSFLISSGSRQLFFYINQNNKLICTLACPCNGFLFTQKGLLPFTVFVCIVYFYVIDA